MERRVALVSMHPEYADKILSGEKKLEFRRRWPTRSIDILFIYATAPVRRIVGFAKVGRVTQGTPTQLWRLAKDIKGGITRRKLFSYLAGKETGFAIELKKITLLPGGVDPRVCLGRGFRPPQSFKYLSDREVLQINPHGKS